jgi:probable addiction module antidote protein
MKRKVKSKNLDFNALVKSELKNPKFAAEYLNEHMTYNGEMKQELLLQAFMNVIEAHGITNVVKKSDIARRTIYSSFKNKGNPTLATLVSLMDELGVKIKFEPKKAG